MAQVPSFPSGPRTGVAKIVNADASAFKSLFAAGASGSRVDTAFITNTDASNAYVVQACVTVSGVDYPIGEVSVPAGAGTNGTTPSVSLLDEAELPALANTEGVLWLGIDATLYVKSKTTVAGANSLAFVATGGDY